MRPWSTIMFQLARVLLVLLLVGCFEPDHSLIPPAQPVEVTSGLTVGDRFEVRVFDEEEVGGAFQVQEDGSMPGRLSYVVAEDPNDPDALWVTEVWVDQAAHRASLQLPAVQAAIAKGRARARESGRTRSSCCRSPLSRRTSPSATCC